jgi:hypothetical protein
MPATIHPSLRAKLDARVLGPFDVVVDFAQLPSSSEIQALGLELDGVTARGRLSREQILAVASFPQVKSIALTDQPLPRQKPEPTGSKLGASLRHALEDKEKDEFDVIVTFHTPPQQVRGIEGLTVRHDMGFGRLTREAVLRLAESDEVAAIALEPKDRLAS